MPQQTGIRNLLAANKNSYPGYRHSRTAIKFAVIQRKNPDSFKVLNHFIE